MGASGCAILALAEAEHLQWGEPLDTDGQQSTRLTAYHIEDSRMTRHGQTASPAVSHHRFDSERKRIGLVGL